MVVKKNKSVIKENKSVHMLKKTITKGICSMISSIGIQRNLKEFSKIQVVSDPLPEQSKVKDLPG